MLFVGGSEAGNRTYFIPALLSNSALLMNFLISDPILTSLQFFVPRPSASQTLDPLFQIGGCESLQELSGFASEMTITAGHLALLPSGRLKTSTVSHRLVAGLP